MNWIGVNAKITLRDGFTKFRRIIEQDTNFITIEYTNGRQGREQIAVTEIVSIKEVRA